MDHQPRAFFLFASDGLRVEPDITLAAGYMEPVDVENGEYEAVFDDTGRSYRFWVEGETTQIEPAEQVDLAALRQRLRALDREGHFVGLEGVDADDPLSVAVAVSRWDWEHRWPRRPRRLARRLHGEQPGITR